MNNALKCNNYLRFLGRAYPRTCAQCALGPCSEALGKLEDRPDAPPAADSPPMTDGQQIDAFDHELKKLIHRFRSEFQITVAGVIGTLEMTKLDLYAEAKGFLTPED